MFNVNDIRKDFPFFKENNSIVYFDNACMSLRPNCVIEAMNDYYIKYNACAGRSAHKLADKVSKKIKESRKIIAKFINTNSENEIIFTRNTTEGINLLANSFIFKEGDVVLISDKEHNSNLLPWLYLRDRIGIKVNIFSTKDYADFDLEEFEKIVKGVTLVCFAYTSNLDGDSMPAKDIIKIAHKNNALVFLDCAQSISHRKIDVKDLDVDFLAFSGHKILGPTGTGIFYGKYKLLENLKPFIVGGNTVEYSTYTDYKFLPIPEKFEAGLLDYAGIIGLGEAIKYMSKLSFKDIASYELMLNTYITEELLKFPQIKIIGPVDPKKRGSIINFYIENKDMHQIAIMLDNMANIAIRSGQHCVHSYFNSRGIKNGARISLSFYNTKKEAEKLVENLKQIMKII